MNVIFQSAWIRSGVASFGVVLLLGCGGQEQAFQSEAWVAKGAATLAPLKAELMGALSTGMQEGPEAAIDQCHLLAPEIADQLRSEGIELGRTSHKLRNPENAPRPWAADLLDHYVTAGEAGVTYAEPQAVPLETGGVGYVEPIFVGAICLNCHGQKLDSGVVARLDAHYPEDQARGFEEGAFRGLFWVEFNGAAAEMP